MVRNFPSGIVEIHASTLNSTTELNFQRVSGEFWRDDLVVIADGIREDDSCADQCIVNATCQGFLIGQQGKLANPENNEFEKKLLKPNTKNCKNHDNF